MTPDTGILSASAMSFVFLPIRLDRLCGVVIITILSTGIDWKTVSGPSLVPGGEKIEIAENKGGLQLPILAELPFLNKVDSGVDSLLDGEVKEQLSKAVDYLLS